MKRKLLWVGDAACGSGFAKATHGTLSKLLDQWDVVVLGINYLGDPHDYPYPIIPCWPGRDMFGLGRLLDVMHGRVVEGFVPDVVVLQNDPWNVPAYLKQMRREPLPVKPIVVGAIAVDGLNCRGEALQGLDHVVFWTEFADREARKGGFTGTSSVIPLGVDTEVYRDGGRFRARVNLGVPDYMREGFIVTNVNRNQPRKRLDLTVRYFAKWLDESGVDDAYLYLHVAPTGDMGYNVHQLANFYDLGRGERKRLVVAEPETFKAASERYVVETYRASDVGFSTTLGEGWGLPAMEFAACCRPLILPDSSAYAEWARDFAVLVPCSSTEANPLSVIGSVMDERLAIEALDQMYRRTPEEREALGAKGRLHVGMARYRWDHISKTFGEVLEQLWQRERASKA